MKVRSLLAPSASDSTETPTCGGSHISAASQMVARTSMSEAGACEILSGPLLPGDFTSRSVGTALPCHLAALSPHPA
jgi:hypothetical protein